MAKNITTWSPDTCSCVMHYEWDTEVPQDDRVHTAVDSVTMHNGQVKPRTVCPAHDDGVLSKPGNHEQHYALVLKENQSKNHLLAHVMDTHEIFAKTDEKGTKSLKDDALVWKHDANRVLHISMNPIATPEQKAEVQAWADTNLGVGKTVIK